MLLFHSSCMTTVLPILSTSSAPPIVIISQNSHPFSMMCVLQKSMFHQGKHDFHQPSSRLTIRINCHMSLSIAIYCIQDQFQKPLSDSVQLVALASSLSTVQFFGKKLLKIFDFTLIKYSTYRAFLNKNSKLYINSLKIIKCDRNSELQLFIYSSIMNCLQI